MKQACSQGDKDLISTSYHHFLAYCRLRIELQKAELLLHRPTIKVNKSRVMFKNLDKQTQRVRTDPTKQ